MRIVVDRICHTLTHELLSLLLNQMLSGWGRIVVCSIRLRSRQMSNWGCNDKVDTNLSVRNGGRGGVLDQWDWVEADVKRSHPWELRDNIGDEK